MALREDFLPGEKIRAADFNSTNDTVNNLVEEVARLAALLGTGGTVTPPPTNPGDEGSGSIPSGTSTPARWWIEYGQLPHTRLTHETRASSTSAVTVAWVASTPDSRVPTSLLEVDVPVLTQTAWEAYLEDMTSPGARAVESGIVTGTSDRWTPASASLVAGRTYRAWARTRVGTDRWSPWASTRFVTPTGRTIFFEDFGAVGDGVKVDGADYQASPAITFGPIRQAIAACNPGDVVKSKQPGTTLRNIGASGTTLTSSSSVFTSAMVGQKVKVYGAGTYAGNYTLSGSNPVVVTIDKTATAVHRATIQSVASDGKSAVISKAVVTAGTGYKVLVGGPTYLINHLDVDSNIGGVNAGRGGMTIDFTGCETTSARETSAGMRIVIPLTTVIGYHHNHIGANFRGNGKNGDSGMTFVEGSNAYGNRWYDCWAERGRDAGFLWYSGPTDQFIVDCTADHTNADPFHVTDTANDIYFIRPVSIYCGDDLGNIGYRSGGDAKRPYNIYWESPKTYGQDWGRTLAYGGTHHALATDVYIDGGAMANFLVGSDGDQANTGQSQIRRFRIINSRIRAGQKAYYSQGANAGTIQDSMWLKLLCNKGSSTVRQADLLIEKGHVTDGNFMQIVCYNGGEFNDASTILRGIYMDGKVNAGLSWVDQGTYNNHIDLRGVTPAGSTAITTAPSAANGTPPGSATSTTGGTGSQPADTTRPSAPTNLTVARPSSGANTLSWTAGTDNVAVAGYNVYGAVSGQTPVKLNGALVTGTSYTHSGTTNGSNYYYEVETVDTAANASASRPNVTTDGPFVTADTTKPSNVTGFAVTRPVSARNDLTWNAASDNVAVAGYNVYGAIQGQTPAKLNSSLITGTSFQHGGTGNNNGYFYEIEAVDTAGNVSASRTNVSTTGNYVPPTTVTPTTTAPSTTAARLLYVDPGTATAAGDGRVSTVPAGGTSGTFGWPSETERPFLVDGPGSKKVLRMQNRRLLLENSGITSRSSITVTLVMSQLQLPAEAGVGMISGVGATDSSYDRAASQWVLRQSASTSETEFQSLSVGGAPVASNTGAFTGFNRPYGTFAVVQYLLSVGQAPQVFVDGVELTSTFSAPTSTSADLRLDRILMGALQVASGAVARPSYYDLASLLVHNGRMDATDRAAVRQWAATAFGTPTPNSGGGGAGNGSTVTRETMVYGTDLPTRELTGVPVGYAFAQTVTSNTFIDTANASYTGYNFKARCVVRAAGVRFKFCLFEGTAAALASDDGMVTATAAGVSDLVLEDCSFIPQTPSMWASGILGHDYTLIRPYFENCVDAMGVYNTNVTNWATTEVPSNVKAYGYLIIKPALFTVPSSRHSDLVSHNDGTQGQGGTGAQLIGGVCYGTASTTAGDQSIDPHGQRRTLSGVLLSHQGPLNDWYIYRCWFADTKFGVTADGSSASKTPRGKIIECRFKNHVVAINLDISQQSGWEVLRNTDWSGAAVNPTYQTTT